ncbi:MAG: type II toxin-antitoxin system CcdA family antitoxin [Nitrospirae bacterium]|jgi:predicted CopG family antitoxin|nr:type II toxin-antitoxin system CcdA family antitoxin [Nitrospirota bacterium]
MSVKTSINIPDDVFNEAKKLSDNFSSVVSEALKEYLRRKKVEKAMSSFGKWGKRDKRSVEIVSDIRKEDKRRYADRNS